MGLAHKSFGPHNYHKTLSQFRTNYSWFWTLASTKRKKHNIKNRKFIFSLHTKKTNNTNKLTFCPYKNSKITKLKNNKKRLFSVPADRYTRNQLVQPVFKPVRNVGVLILVDILVWYGILFFAPHPTRTLYL